MTGSAGRSLVRQSAVKKDWWAKSLAAKPNTRRSV